MNGIGVGLTALLAVAFSGNPTDDDATLDNFRQQSATRLSSTPHIQSLPYALDPDCKNGRASVFDECSDQRVIFDAGLSLAKAEGKTLLGPVDKLDSQSLRDVIQDSFCGGYLGAVADGGCRVGIL